MTQTQPRAPASLPARALLKLTLKQRLAARLQNSWVQKDWLSLALLDVSYVYRGLVALRSRLYARGIFKSERMPVPVIVVGNVVAGGAGKTPVVIEIVRDLLSRGWQPGVVSRGYGRVADKAAAPALEVTANTPVSASGDEPALIKHALESALSAPVFVANKRTDAVKALLAAYPQTNVIVCDDGLQHLALQRDIEVCVFDARGVGNGRLLPAGPLREPWPRSSKPSEPWPRSTQTRAVDFVLAQPLSVRTGPAEVPQKTSASSVATQMQHTYSVTRQLADYALRSDGSRMPLDQLRTQPVTALAAIAQPEAFFTMLRDAGLQLQETIPLPDHYNFDSWSRIAYAGYSLVCTQKDAVKLWQHAPDALAVPLLVSIDPAFFTALHDKLSSLATKP